MAYNSYFPVAYQPNFYGYNNPYYQQTEQNQPSQQPTIQRSGFVLVQSEQEARSYPVAPGNSITFKDESKPYCYVKTMGFSQFDQPSFERYKLVKEDSPQETAKMSTVETYALKTDVTSLWSALDDLKDRVNKMVGVQNDEE